MNFKLIYTVIISFFIVFNVLGAYSNDTIIVNNPNELKLIGKQIGFLEDKSSSLTISGILKPENQRKFTKQEKSVYTNSPSNTAIWFIITIQNLTGETLWLETGGSYSEWYIDFYRPDSTGNYSGSVETGALRSVINKEYPSEFYWFKIAGADEKTAKTFYIRIKSEVSPVFPFYVGTFKTLDDKRHKFFLITFLFLGAMIIMFLYNLFLFFVTNDKIYLSYVFFILMNALCYTFNNNFSFVEGYFWWWNKHIAWQFLGDLSSTIFILHFLGLNKNFPLAFKIYIGLIAADLFIAILNLSGITTLVLIETYMQISLLLIINTVFTGLYLLIKRQNNAKIFALSWSFLLISLAIFMMVINGILPYAIFTRYLVYIGISLEALLFSMALANRLKILRKEKEAILEENIKLVQNHNIILEKEVKEKTKELEVKNDNLKTYIKYVDEQNNKISQQNVELQKLTNYKEEMTNMIIHDLKNPLNVILGLAENELVIKSGKNMLNLVTNILDVYKNSEAKIILDKKDFSLYDISNSAINEVSFLSKFNNIFIKTEISKEISVSIDKEIIKRVFMNILNNAIKYTPFNGSISIESEEIDAEDDKPKMIKILISDTGKGIPEDKIDIIFNKFAQVVPQKSGHVDSTGIGLTFCKMAIEAHGGEIGVQSKVGFGTTFWFTLFKSNKIPVSDSEDNQNTKDDKEFSDMDKELIRDMLNKINQLEFYEAGEILKIINIFKNGTHPSVDTYADKIKNAVLSGNLAEYERLLYFE